MNRGWSDEPDGFEDMNESGFRDPGGRSALRVGARRYKCPTCGRPRMLTKADVDRGYQCDRCADVDEGLFPGGYGS